MPELANATATTPTHFVLTFPLLPRFPFSTFYEASGNANAVIVMPDGMSTY